jgi:hypothetical protein
MTQVLRIHITFARMHHSTVLKRITNADHADHAKASASIAVTTRDNLEEQVGLLASNRQVADFGR